MRSKTDSQNRLQVSQAMDMFENCRMEFSTSGNNLSCITNLLVFLVRLMTGMNKEETAKIAAALSPIINQGYEQVHLRLGLMERCHNESSFITNRLKNYPDL
jgi:hypothetical protein